MAKAALFRGPLDVYIPYEPHDPKEVYSSLITNRSLESVFHIPYRGPLFVSYKDNSVLLQDQSRKVFCGFNYIEPSASLYEIIDSYLSFISDECPSLFPKHFASNFPVYNLNLRPVKYSNVFGSLENPSFTSDVTFDVSLEQIGKGNLLDIVMQSRFHLINNESPFKLLSSLFTFFEFSYPYNDLFRNLYKGIQFSITSSEEELVHDTTPAKLFDNAGYLSDIVGFKYKRIENQLADKLLKEEGNLHIVDPLKSIFTSSVNRRNLMLIIDSLRTNPEKHLNITLNDLLITDSSYVKN